MNLKSQNVKFAVIAALLVGFVVCVAAAALGHPLVSLLGFSGILFGVNTVTYEYPVTGVTAPTAAQIRTHQQLSAVITGDGAATTFTVTHNWGLNATEIANGWPEVEYEYLLAAGYTAAALITSKAGGNAVAFSNTAFTGAGLRVRLKRPWTPSR